MKVVVLDAMKKRAKVWEVFEGDELKFLHEIVAETVEVIPHDDMTDFDILRNYDIYADEEGVLNNRKPNIYLGPSEDGVRVVFGTVVVAGHDKEGNITSCKEEDIEEIEKALEARRAQVETARAFYEAKVEKKPGILSTWESPPVRKGLREGWRAIVAYRDRFYFVDVRWTEDNGNEAEVADVTNQNFEDLNPALSDPEVFPTLYDGYAGLIQFIDSFDWEEMYRKGEKEK